MKNEAINKIRLGIFISAGIILFIAGVFYIGERQHLFGSTIRLKFICADVSGLQVGNNVRFSGIDVGTVSSVEITSDTTIEVEMLIERRVRKFIKKNAQASIGSEGLMGDKVVNISEGGSDQKPVENGDFLACVEGNNIDQIMNKAKIVAQNAAQITGDIAAITDNIREGKGSVGKLFMDTTFARNLSQTMVNIREGSGGLNQDLTAAQHSFLLRPYFKKKEREKEKKEEQKE